MNISLKKRITASFVITNLCVLVIGFTVFYFMDSLNKQIVALTNNNTELSNITDEIRSSAVTILKTQKKILLSKSTADDLNNLNVLCESFQNQLQRLDSHYEDVEVKKNIAKMQGFVESLSTILSKTSPSRRDESTIQNIGDLADKILEAFSDFQEFQFADNERRDQKFTKIREETRRNMLIILIITFLFTILLSLIMPGKIALPFKKINDAIRELQDCNFDVSIYYDQDDEIGELAKEINKLISNLKNFEELRADRISVENRKFDIMANMLHKHVMVANSRGELIYMNNSVYSLLEIQSEDVLKKNMSSTIIPPSIRENFELAIKRRSKIENAEIKIENTVNDEQGNEKVEVDFEGFANIIPIRGKNSSLDYYIMVMSKEVFE